MIAKRTGEAKPYDLRRGIKDFDALGDLPIRLREVWAMIEGCEVDLARAFWQRYRLSVELTEKISDEKVEELARRVAPYIRNQYSALESYEWVDQANDFVDRAMQAGITLSTLLTGLAGKTELARAKLFAERKFENAEMHRFQGALSDLLVLETDIYVHRCLENIRVENAVVQTRQASEFNKKVLGVVERCTSESHTLPIDSRENVMNCRLRASRR